MVKHHEFVSSIPKAAWEDARWAFLQLSPSERESLSATGAITREYILRGKSAAEILDLLSQNPAEKAALEHLGRIPEKPKETE